MISNSFELLCQAFRIQIESTYKLNYLRDDPGEAIGNIETSFNSILNSFHHLFDAIRKEDKAFNYDIIPELALIATLRNARHHNIANGIRGIYNYHFRAHNAVDIKDSYLLIDFVAGEEGADTIEYFVSWGDLYLMLGMHKKESWLKTETIGIINDYLNNEDIIKEAKRLGYEHTHIFINAIPLILNAGIKLYPFITGKNEPLLTIESKHFDFHFREVKPSIIDKHLYTELKDFYIPVD